MKKIVYLIVLACSASIAGAMQTEVQQQQWLILVEVSDEHTDKKEAFDKIDKEARESLKERYLRGYEMASMWMLTVNSNTQEDIKELLKDRPWIKNATMCPNFKLTMHRE